MGVISFYDAIGFRVKVSELFSIELEELGNNHVRVTLLVVVVVGEHRSSPAVLPRTGSQRLLAAQQRDPVCASAAHAKQQVQQWRPQQRRPRRRLLRNG